MAVAESWSKTPVADGKYLGLTNNRSEYVWTDAQGNITGSAKDFSGVQEPVQYAYGSGLTAPDPRVYYNYLASGTSASDPRVQGAAYDVAKNEAQNQTQIQKNAAYDAAIKTGDTTALKRMGASEERISQVLATTPKYDTSKPGSPYIDNSERPQLREVTIKENLSMGGGQAASQGEAILGGPKIGGTGGYTAPVYNKEEYINTRFKAIGQPDLASGVALGNKLTPAQQKLYDQFERDYAEQTSPRTTTRASNEVVITPRVGGGKEVFGPFKPKYVEGEDNMSVVPSKYGFTIPAGQGILRTTDDKWLVSPFGYGAQENKPQSLPFTFTPPTEVTAKSANDVISAAMTASAAKYSGATTRPKIVGITVPGGSEIYTRNTILGQDAVYSENPNRPASDVISDFYNEKANQLTNAVTGVFGYSGPMPKGVSSLKLPVLGFDIKQSNEIAKGSISTGVRTAVGIPAYVETMSNTGRQFVDITLPVEQYDLTGKRSVDVRVQEAKGSVVTTAVPLGVFAAGGAIFSGVGSVFSPTVGKILSGEASFIAPKLFTPSIGGVAGQAPEIFLPKIFTSKTVGGIIGAEGSKKTAENLMLGGFALSTYPEASRQYTPEGKEYYSPYAGLGGVGLMGGSFIALSQAKFNPIKYEVGETTGTGAIRMKSSVVLEKTGPSIQPSDTIAGEFQMVGPQPQRVSSSATAYTNVQTPLKKTFLGVKIGSEVVKSGEVVDMSNLARASNFELSKVTSSPMLEQGAVTSVGKRGVMGYALPDTKLPVQFTTRPEAPFGADFVGPIKPTKAQYGGGVALKVSAGGTSDVPSTGVKPLEYVAPPSLSQKSPSFETTLEYTPVTEGFFLAAERFTTKISMEETSTPFSYDKIIEPSGYTGTKVRTPYDNYGPDFIGPIKPKPQIITQGKEFNMGTYYEPPPQTPINTIVGFASNPTETNRLTSVSPLVKGGLKVTPTETVITKPSKGWFAEKTISGMKGEPSIGKTGFEQLQATSINVKDEIYYDFEYQKLPEQLKVETIKPRSGRIENRFSGPTVLGVGSAGIKVGLEDAKAVEGIKIFGEKTTKQPNYYQVNSLNLEGGKVTESSIQMRDIVQSVDKLRYEAKGKNMDMTIDVFGLTKNTGNALPLPKSEVFPEPIPRLNRFNAEVLEGKPNKFLLEAELNQRVLESNSPQVTAKDFIGPINPYSPLGASKGVHKYLVFKPQAYEPSLAKGVSSTFGEPSIPSTKSSVVAVSETKTAEVTQTESAKAMMGAVASAMEQTATSQRATLLARTPPSYGLPKFAYITMPAMATASAVSITAPQTFTTPSFSIAPPKMATATQTLTQQYQPNKEYQIPRGQQVPIAYQIPKGIQVPRGLEVPKELQTPRGLQIPRGIEILRGIETPREIQTPRQTQIQRQVEIPRNPFIPRTPPSTPPYTPPPPPPPPPPPEIPHGGGFLNFPTSGGSGPSLTKAQKGSYNPSFVARVFDIRAKGKAPKDLSKEFTIRPIYGGSSQTGFNVKDTQHKFKFTPINLNGPKKKK